MNQKKDRAAIVLQGYLRLSGPEREQLVEELGRLRKASGYRKVQLEEGIEKRADLSLGPLAASGCPCCGK